jgi:clan AA aspartic protease (TIGR02281 family)
VVVDATVTGPAGKCDVKLVLDTGASATTLIPEVASKIGYGPQDGYRDATVHTAIGREYGYWLHVLELDAVGVTTSDFALMVFPLEAGVDGLLGMNFLRYFNFEIRPAEKRILLELIDPSRAI